jgi:tetratricopeptide (TPR) repeat protein
LVAAFFTGAAHASSFDDFNQGIAARNRGDSDTAIAAFNRALTAGDLAPSLQHVALFDRGIAYAAKKKFPEAIADFSAVIKLKPDYVEAYFWRAQAYDVTAQRESAASDCGAMVALKNDAHMPFGWCGRLQFEIGNYAQAEWNFRNALRLERTPVAYDVLWLDLSRLREGQGNANEFTESARAVDLNGWPSPILDYFSGQGSLETIDAAATKGDATAQKNQKCEVGFYVGEWLLAHNDTSDAKPLLEQAVELCPVTFIETEPAKAEMARLNHG